MAFRQNAREHRQRFLGAVFFVADQEDDGLARTRTLATREVEPAGARSKRVGSQQKRRGENQGSGSGPAGEGIRHGVMKGETVNGPISCKRPVRLRGFIFGHFYHL